MENQTSPFKLDEIFKELLASCHNESTRKRLLSAAERWKQQSGVEQDTSSPIDQQTGADEKNCDPIEANRSDAADELIASILAVQDPFATMPPEQGANHREELLAGGRFRIIRQHAEGGLGRLLIASDEELQRKVALKEIKSKFASDDTFRERFVLEAKVTGNLEHPGVVPVYGLGTFPDGRPYYAMRFIQGVTLKAAIEKLHALQADESTRNLELRKLLSRFSHVCETIAYAHSRHIVHRDIKPDNIMLGDYGETLVVDWGLAKMMNRPTNAPVAETATSLSFEQETASQATRHGDLVGTLGYMSPEQASGRIDLIAPASDVYGLGATLYHLLTGKCSVRDDAMNVMIDRIRRGDFLRPRQVNRRVPPALEAICLKAMAVEPEDRYSSAKELTRELERWLADEPVLCYRESLVERTARFARRHRGWTQSLAVMFAVITLGSIIATILINRALNREAMSRYRAEQAAKFVRNLFRGSNPLGFNSGDELGFGIRETGGTELKARDLVDRGAKRIREELKGEPLLASQLLDTIGSVYGDLGLFDDAVSCFRESLTQKAKVLPPDDLTIAVTKARLAWALHFGGHRDDAEELYKESLAMQMHSEDPQAELDATSTMLRYGLLLTEKGDTKEAENWLNKATEIRRAKLGDNSQAVAIAKIYEAALKFVQQDFDGGNGAVTEAWLIFEKLHDEQIGPAKAISLFQGGLGLMGTGDFNAAEHDIRKAQQLAEEVLGPNHPYCAWALGAHGEALLRLGRYPEAEQQMLKSERIATRFVKAQHPHLCKLRIALAELYLETDRPKDSERLLRENLELLRTSHPTYAADIARAECLLGELLRMRGDLTEAEAAYGLALERTRDDERLTTNHTTSLIGLGNCAIQGKNFEAAKGHFENALTILRRQPAANAAEIANASVDLGEVLLMMEETKEAEKTLSAAWEYFKTAKRTTMRWRAASLYGRCLYLRKQLDESEKLLASAFKAARDDGAFNEHNQHDARKLAWAPTTANWLIELYQGRGRKADADKLRNELAELTKQNKSTNQEGQSSEAPTP